MKVKIVSTFNRNCGIGQYTEHLTQQLRSSGVMVQAFRKDGASDEVFRPYPYRSFRSWQYRVAPYFLKKALKDQEADIWHADYVSSFQGLSWAEKKAPKVVTVHDAIPYRYPGKSLDFRIYKRQMRLAVNQAKYLITVSESARQEVIDLANVAPSQVVSIPNGIDISQFRLKGPVAENSIFTIRYLGGLGAPHKNVAMLLYMARILEDQRVRFKLEIGGYIPAKHSLRTLANKLRLQSVDFSGFIEDDQKARFLTGADLFVFPSLMEGFGFPPMEAMASRTAVLASRIPVFEELLSNAALLAEPDPEAFARAIKKVMNSENLQHEMAEKGHDHIKKYSWEIASSKTLEVYKKALN